MAVRITKPEINVREKLSELEYSRIPYEKMPAGSIIQTKYQVQGGSGTVNESETSSSSYQPTSFNVSITPMFENSLIVVTASPNIKMNGDSGYQTIALFAGYDSQDYFQVLPTGGTASNSPHGQGTFRFTGVSTFWSNASILQIHKPETTRLINYKLYQRNSSGGFVVRLGENGADEYMMVQEIKQ
ncbi:hypothetical protein N9C48_01605 [bacterium]|nr:hypothetical protein [bacterium]